MVPKRKVIIIYNMGDPNYEQLNQAIKDVAAEKPKEWDPREFQRVETTILPEVASRYEYEQLPAMYFNGEKIYEYHEGVTDDEIKDLLRDTYRELASIAAKL
ncbi:MAG: hypothetical protein PUB39_02960 [Eubacteriales bacterium]|nr:hypothetical protein [Eubacteriales bacterium]